MSYDFKKFNENKEKILNHLILEYKSIQTGIANPQVLDLIFINAYGSKMQLSHVASISVETSTNLIVSPYDKSLLKEIEKAINEADLGISTSPDESNLRVFFPKPTTEIRQKMNKIVKEKLEEARVKLRSIREEVKKDIESKSKNGELSKDEEIKILEELQNLINISNKEFEEISNKKEKDILTI